MRVLLLIIIALMLLNSLLIAIYCRLAEKQDARIEAKRKQQYNDANHDIGAVKPSEKKGIKKMIGGVYGKMNPYLYGWMRYCIVITGKIPSHRTRNIIYRLIFNMKITKNTVIYSGCELRSPWNIHADRCVISTNCIIDGRRGVYIGQDVVFGGGVHLWTEEHDVNDPQFRVNYNNAQSVKIGAHAWICSDSTILPGVQIGEGCVLATRAVATKNCEEYSVYGGIPAKKIGSRNHELLYKLNGKPTWHFY
ncbi:acyltransferase [Ruminococcus sp.]|uniref:acyltransferase n=1 Tax=Ruminococcus sp. TaxID=41978 RepID=UPI0025FA1E40|nr:acyltransferase [Ruminococcus sp.]